MGRGKLIAFEGIDGSGKTTISTRVYQAAKSQGIPALYAFEPTFSKAGGIVHLILSGDVVGSGAFQALMFAADRVNHFDVEIRPNLELGINVFVDRYVHSSVAYQGAMLKDEGWIRTINRYVPAPDLAIYIDVDPRSSLRRRSGRSIYERTEFLDEVRAVYRRMVAQGELVEVDGEKPEDEVFKEVWKLVRDELRL